MNSLRPLFIAAIQTVAVAFCLINCSFADEKGPGNAQEKVKRAEFDKTKLIGTWSYSRSEDGVSVVGTSEFKKDGTMVGKCEFKTSSETTIYEYEAIWSLVGDIMEQTLTKSNLPEMIPIGSVTKDKVLNLTETEFVYVDEEGNKATETRIIKKDK